MMEAEKLDAGRESNEVELSTEDLLAMSPSPRSAASLETLAREREGQEALPAPAPPVQASTVSAQQAHPVRSNAPRARRMSVAAVMLTVGAIAAAAAAVVAIVPMDREPEVMVDAAPLAEPDILEEPAPPPEVEGPPVYFTNPFDETEVFEFPPGTSREEARAAVADLLIMRARERMELFEAQARKR